MNTNKETKHTPTPWHISDEHRIVDEQGGLVADVKYAKATTAEAMADAEFISRAVNSHEALLEAAKKVVKEYSALPINGPETVIIKSIDDLQEAIAQAEGRGV